MKEQNEVCQISSLRHNSFFAVSYFDKLRAGKTFIRAGSICSAENNIPRQ
uniref:Uncharacterized protein n=1 Tax=Anguilla anguilla TaxID=7936 RepID=A0A0E9VME1_ANGAN